ncbi:MAG: DUF4388 domain-containing protein [Polyangia bacterium]
MAPVNEDLSQLLGRLAAGIDDVIEAEMSTALEAVGDEGPASAGALAEIGLPVLMGRIFSDGTTGRLRIWQEPVEKSVYFEAGLPVMAASNDVADRMLAMLVRERTVSTAQREEVEKIVGASGRKVGGVLVDLGFLRSDELLPAVRRHYESIILSLFGWTAGLWQIEPGMTAGPERTRLLRHPAALVREGLARGYSSEKIAAHVGSGKNLFALDTSGTSADVVKQMLTDPAEARVPLLFDGVRSLDEVARSSGLPDATVWQIAFALSCFGALRPARSGGGANEGLRFGVRDLQIARERLLARQALAQEGDYFQILGVDRQADATEIRRAHQRLVRECSPEALGPDLSHELKTALETIREVLDEGLRVLSTPALRAAYELNQAPEVEAQPPQPESAAEPSADAPRG